MSCNNHNSDINQTFIIEPLLITTGNSSTITACTSVFTNEIISCDSDTQISLLSGETVFNTSILPLIDSTIDFGIPIRRFRNINTVSGASTVWTSTIKVITPMLDLGVDSSGFTRQITANNSIIQYDVLDNGNY
jgi:hypothetical protein